MERNKNRITIVIDENGKAVEANDLAHLFHCVKNMKVETIVFGEVDNNGDLLFEKQFSEATVMPSEFGK